MSIYASVTGEFKSRPGMLMLQARGDLCDARLCDPLFACLFIERESQESGIGEKGRKG